MKKRINPNRVPAVRSREEARQCLKAMTREQDLVAWMAMLAAITGLGETTRDSLLELHRQVEDYPKKLTGFGAVQALLEEINALTGGHEAVEPIRTDGLRTQADFLRFQRKTRRNIVLMDFCMIAEPILRLGLMEPDTFAGIWKRAVSNFEEIENGQIRIRDIQEMLQEEYGIRLGYSARGVQL